MLSVTFLNNKALCRTASKSVVQEVSTVSTVTNVATVTTVTTVATFTTVTTIFVKCLMLLLYAL